jgi:hypothetical protein
MTAVLNGLMAKKPKKPAATRKPFKQARIRYPLAALADERATELVTDFNQYVNDAVRMRLEAEGKWPPPPKGK